MKMGAIDATLL